MASITQPKAKRPINEVIIHCTATPEGRDISVQTIREWHKGNGWSDIGYHWVVLLDGPLVRSGNSACGFTDKAGASI